MEIAFIILPLLIFLARVVNVGLGTLRVIFVSKGFKVLAPMFGFFEILVWIVATKGVLDNNAGFWVYIAYAAGFGIGNLVGICVEERLYIGKVMLRIITQKDADDLIKNLRKEGYPLTVIDAKGRDGDVNVIYSVIEKRDLKAIVKTITKTNPHAFYSVEDLRFASRGKVPLDTEKLVNFERKINEN